MPWPLRNTAIDFEKPASQCSSVISAPSGANQEMSGRPSRPRRRTGLPLKKRRLRNTGWFARSADTTRVNSSSPASASPQSIQVSSLSWQ